MSDGQEVNGSSSLLYKSLISTTVLVALIGLFGTGIGIYLQGVENNQLENLKFESALVQKAIAGPSQKEAAQTLKFLQSIGLLKRLNQNYIKNVVDGKEILPIWPGAAIRDGLTTVLQVKNVLKYLKYYDGTLDDLDNLEYRISVMHFQKDKNINIDGYIGPITLLALWDSCPACPALLQRTRPSSASAQ